MVSYSGANKAHQGSLLQNDHSDVAGSFERRSRHRKKIRSDLFTETKSDRKSVSAAGRRKHRRKVDQPSGLPRFGKFQAFV